MVCPKENSYLAANHEVQDTKVRLTVLQFMPDLDFCGVRGVILRILWRPCLRW